MLRFTPAHMRATMRAYARERVCSSKPDETTAVDSLTTKILNDVIKPLINNNQPIMQKYLRAATNEKHIANYASIGWHAIGIGWVTGFGICTLLTWRKAYKEH